MMQRYKFHQLGPCIGYIEERDKGEWVRYSDAHALEVRNQRLEAALLYLWDLADMHSWEIGVHHSSTDVVAQRLTYSCSGCLASVVRSPETNGPALAAMNFPHGPDCKYVELQDLAEARRALEGA